MESIFENEFTCTEEFYSEYWSYFYFKRPGMMVLHIIFGLALVLGILCALFPTAFPIETPLILIYIIVPILILPLNIYKFYNSKNLSYKRNQEIGKGKVLENKVIVTENEIQSISSFSSTEISVELSKIKKVAQTKNYYICISESKLAYTLKKDSFTKGTAKEFEEFLKNAR